MFLFAQVWVFPRVISAWWVQLATFRCVRWSEIAGVVSRVRRLDPRPRLTCPTCRSPHCAPRGRVRSFANWPICGLGGVKWACDHQVMGGRLRVDRMCRHTGQVVNDDGRVIVARCHVADRPLARLIGLLGTSQLAPDEGVWITPCRSVHMFGMRQSIACVFVDGDGVVCDLRDVLAPGSHATARGARSAIEAAPGTFSGVSLGDRLRLVVDQSPADP